MNGQSLSGPALQASMSMLSLAPAASTAGWAGSTATAGSFCLFCENGLVGTADADARVLRGGRAGERRDSGEHGCHGSQDG